MPSRRGNRVGSISWLTPSKVLLRVSVDGRQRSKTVHVRHRKRGGTGDADTELKKFQADIQAELEAPPKSEGGEEDGALAISIFLVTYTGVRRARRAACGGRTSTPRRRRCALSASGWPDGAGSTARTSSRTRAP